MYSIRAPAGSMGVRFLPVTVNRASVDDLSQLFRMAAGILWRAPDACLAARPATAVRAVVRAIQEAPMTAVLHDPSFAFCVVDRVFNVFVRMPRSSHRQSLG